MTATVLRLDLPFTAPPLKDNDRHHWRVKAAHTKTIRDTVRLLARSQRLPQGLDRVDICLHWQPGSNRRRDPLSPAPTLKAAVDGLVDANVIPDDDTRHVSSLSCCIHDWQRGTPAGCWLTITPTSSVQRTTTDKETNDD